MNGVMREFEIMELIDWLEGIKAQAFGPSCRKEIQLGIDHYKKQYLGQDNTKKQAKHPFGNNYDALPSKKSSNAFTDSIFGKKGKPNKGERK